MENPRHKATIVPAPECFGSGCLLVDDNLVPHCDCTRHGGMKIEEEVWS